MNHLSTREAFYSLPFWCLGLVISFAFPLAIAALSCLLYFHNDKIISRLRFPPSFCIALTLSLINSSKVAEGDLIAYLLYFKDLESLSLTEVFLRYITEPVFYLVAWVFGHVFSFSDFTFKFCFSLVGYLSLLFASERIMSGMGLSKKKVLLGLLIIGLSATIFANSLHLVRQFVSLSFFVLALSGTTRTWKYLGFLLSFLTHVSTGILIAFYFMVHAPRVIKMLIFFGIMFSEKIISAFVFISMSTGLSPLVYFASRLSADKFHDMPGLSGTAQLFLFVTLAFLIGTLVFKGNSYHLVGPQRATLQVKKLYELSILLGISVLVIQFVLGLNEPAARLMFSYVVLMMVAFASSLSFLRIGSISLTLGVMALSANFIFGMDVSTWTYSNGGQSALCFLVCSII